MDKFAIEVMGLRKSFSGQTVLDGIDLHVPEGTIFALLGPNGAGKTTIVHILSTLLAPDEGMVRVEGYEVGKQKNDVKRSIGLTGQFAAVDDMLTAEENLRMIGVISGGRVVAKGTADELKSLAGGMVLELRDNRDEVIRTVPTTGRYRDIRHILNEIADVGEIPQDARLSIRTPSMDDVFVALTATPHEEEEASAL